MAEQRHTAEELKQWQSLPLPVKILMTQERIRQYVNYFGEDSVCVSFSGGKDSTVLLDIVRKMYPGVPAVFSNTGLEYPEIQKFVRKHDNVEIVTPGPRFVDVITEYGYPLIGKEVAEAIYYARKLRGGGRNQTETRRLSCEAVARHHRQEMQGRRTRSSERAEPETAERSSQGTWGGSPETVWKRSEFHGLRAGVVGKAGEESACKVTQHLLATGGNTNRERKEGTCLADTETPPG